MKTKAAVGRAWNTPYTIEEIDIEAPKEKEVMVKVAHTGWCHSDLSGYKNRYALDDSLLPAVPGHESAGVVHSVGPGVTSLQPGDHVVTCWQAPCGQCEACVSGNTHICEWLLIDLGTGKLKDGTARFRDKDGSEINHSLYVSGFSEYIVTPEISSVKVSKELPLDQACLLGCCVGTGWGAVNRSARVQAGETVAIWGMGGVGLNVVRGAALAGANPIIAVDLEGSKEAIAKEMGATHFINSSQGDPVPMVKSLTGEKGVHYAFEVTGDVGASVQASYTLRNGGKLMQVGIPAAGEEASYQLFIMPFQAQSVQGVLYGSLRHQIDIPILADMALKGDLMIDTLITKHFKLEEINEVREAMEKREIIGRWVCDL
ncbi:MAG: alcohol dehydrogenase catalytic domain-containing protein [Proteobacteria bacterium]|nr:alcohol dehydrogenase catalytic domain-containing protein [Pseudomonadota bacterium]